MVEIDVGRFWARSRLEDLQQGEVPFRHYQIGNDDLKWATSYRIPRTIEVVYKAQVVKDDKEGEREFGEDVELLEWRDVAGTADEKEAVPSPQCLSDFLRLADVALDNALAARRIKAIREFVTRWGALGLWPYAAELKGVDSAYKLQERTDYYIRFARQMKAIISTVIWLREGGANADHDPPARWSLRDLTSILVRESALADNEPEIVANVMSSWLRCASVNVAQMVDTKLMAEGKFILRPSFQMPGWQEGIEWDSSPKHRYTLGRERYPSFDCLPNSQQRPSPLFAVLVMQLNSLLLSPNGIYLCQYCGQPFTRERRPKRNVCGDTECSRRHKNRRQNATNTAKRLAQKA